MGWGDINEAAVMSVRAGSDSTGDTVIVEKRTNARNEQAWKIGYV